MVMLHGNVAAHDNFLQSRRQVYQATVMIRFSPRIPKSALFLILKRPSRAVASTRQDEADCLV